MSPMVSKPPLTPTAPSLSLCSHHAAMQGSVPPTPRLLRPSGYASLHAAFRPLSPLASPPPTPPPPTPPPPTPPSPSSIPDTSINLSLPNIYSHQHQQQQQQQQHQHHLHPNFRSSPPLSPLSHRNHHMQDLYASQGQLAHEPHRDAAAPAGVCLRDALAGFCPDCQHPWREYLFLSVNNFGASDGSILALNAIFLPLEKGFPN